MRDRQAETAVDPTRRAVLAGAGALGASALLAGCSYDTSQLRDKYTTDDSAAGGQGTGAQAPATQNSTAPAGKDATPAANSGGQQGGGNPDALAATGDIPVGGGKVFADDKVVVTQPTAGTFKAFDTTCSHAGCAVTKISGGTINCPCHGAKFSVEDGSVKGGPAPTALQEVAIKVDGDSIQLA